MHFLLERITGSFQVGFNSGDDFGLSSGAQYRKNDTVRISAKNHEKTKLFGRVLKDGDIICVIYDMDRKRVSFSMGMNGKDELDPQLQETLVHTWPYDAPRRPVRAGAYVGNIGDSITVL